MSSRSKIILLGHCGYRKNRKTAFEIAYFEPNSAADDPTTPGKRKIWPGLRNSYNIVASQGPEPALAVAAEEAGVFIADHHEGDIAWADCQRHLQIMHSNGGNFTREESVLAAGVLFGISRVF